MKLTNGQIFAAVQSLGEVTNKDLPVKTAYWLARLVQKLDGTYKVISKIRDEIITKWGTPGDKGQLQVAPGAENWDFFIMDQNELMSQEVEVDVSPVTLPIMLPLEVDGKEFTISTHLLFVLESFVAIEGLDRLEITPVEDVPEETPTEESISE